MARYTNTPKTSLKGINAELVKVQDAFEDVLDRRGDGANFLDTDLDMNSQRILNLPEPVYSQEPVRLGDVKPFIDDTKTARDAAVEAAGVAQESEEQAAVSAGQAASSAEQSATSAANSAAKAKDLTEITSALLISQGLSGEYGFFEKGFTYNSEGDVGIDSDGNIWTYNGALPFEVDAGTTPTTPTYTKVTFNSASNVSSSNGGSVQNYIDTSPPSFREFSDIGSSNFSDTYLSFLYNNDIRIKTRSYESSSSAGGAEYKVLTESEKTSLGYTDGLNSIEIGSSGLWACLVIKPTILLSKAGLTSSNLQAVLNSLYSYCTSNNAHLECLVDIGQVASSGVDIDLRYVKVDFLDVIYNASSVNGYALKVLSSEAPSYNNLNYGIRNLPISGSRVDGNKGILFDSPVTNANSRSYLENVSISNFGEGIETRDSAYLIKGNRVSIYFCNTCVNIPNGSDSGENISFIDSALFNSTVILNCEEPSATVTFTNCSLDYSQKVITMTGGLVRMNGGHIETNSSLTHLEILGGVCILEPTVLRYDGSIPPDFYAEVDGTLLINTRVSFGDVAQKTLSDRFYFGSGVCDITNRSQAKMPKLLSNNLSDNLNVQPFFNSLSGEVFFTESATASHTSTDATMEAVNNSLVVTKTSSNDVKFALSGKINQPLSSIGCIIQCESSSGTWGYQLKYVKLDETQPIPLIEKSSVVKSTTGLSGNTEITSNRLTDISPKWATHWICEIDASLIPTGETIAVSEARIQRLG